MRVGVVCDLKEERWPSMDLVADMLLEHLPEVQDSRIDVARVQPEFRWRFAGGENGTGRWSGKRFTLDRALNRFWDYPRHLGKLRSDFDLFHVVDHAYSQLVHELPPEQTVVTCHDLHTFQCLLEESGGKRSRPFRAMTRYVLRGLERAGRIVVDTAAVGDEIVRRGIAARDSVEVVHLGVHPAFNSQREPRADLRARRLLGGDADEPYLLHVGGTFARKRIDLVLRIFAEVSKEHPSLRLVRVGGRLTVPQAVLAEELGITGSIASMPFIDTEVLAAVYRGASLVLLPSEEEGFGFPVLESMACGTPVVASDLAVLREVGGEAAAYAAVGDVRSWADLISELLVENAEHGPARQTRVQRGICHSARFTWAEYARKMVDVYQRMLSH